MWLVLRQGILLSAVGVGVGLPIAIGAGHLVQGLLVGISPADPLALGGPALLVMAVAALASYLPARRATRVNPMDALRAG